MDRSSFEARSTSIALHALVDRARSPISRNRPLAKKVRGERSEANRHRLGRIDEIDTPTNFL
jgi:hypothetical protein